MFTPEAFVAACRDCVNNGGSASEIELLVREALRDQAHEPPLWEGEELMHRSPNLTIINLTLPGLGKTAVHDHGMWAVIGISGGCEVERFYASGADGLVQIGRIEVHDGQTVCLASDVIHDIENPNIQAARGLHVYGGDLTTVARRMWNPQDQAELAFHFPTFERWAEELSASRKLTSPSSGQP
jgi:predicted metal-dependent enzyme (double-stranded beta helix superfamily)